MKDTRRRYVGLHLASAGLLIGAIVIFGFTGSQQNLVSAERPPSAIPSAVLFDIENKPISLTTDSGLADAVISGSIFLIPSSSTGAGGETQLYLSSAMLYIDSVPTSRGDTGSITLAFESGNGTARLNRKDISMNVGLQGGLTYELIDRVLGVRSIDDYTESFAETVVGSLAFSGRFRTNTNTYDGELGIGFQVTHPLLGVIVGGQMQSVPVSIPLQPFLPTVANKKEICIEIAYENNAARQQWSQDSDMDGRSDVEQMIDEANEIWCTACNIRVRTKLLGDRDCISVILRVTYAEGGGGTCAGLGQGNNSTIQIGRNVLTTCMNQGVTTTYGRVLAHEVGHSLGIPQRRGGGGLMDDCAPSSTVSDTDCQLACKKTKPITQPAEPVRASYAFSNPANSPVNDLHIEFDRPVWVVSSGFFKDFRGEGTNKLDFGRGTVGAGSGTLIRVVGDGRKPKCKSCFWTVDGRNVGGCVCPKEGE